MQFKPCIVNDLQILTVLKVYSSSAMYFNINEMHRSTTVNLLVL